MSDHRGDEPTEPTEPDDDLHIEEMSPPPPPADADEPTSAVPPPPPPDPPSSPDSAADDPPSPSDEPVAAAPPPVVAPPVEPVAPAAPIDEKRPWPGAAKALVAILVVLVLLGVVGTVVGFMQASSTDDDLADVRDELALSQDRVVALEDQLASLGDETGTLSERLDQLMAERDAALIERDAAIAARDEQAAIDEAERALLESQVEELTSEIEAIEEQFEELFPLEVRVDLGAVGIAGDYEVSLTEIGCAGLDGLCGSAPSVGDATIGDDLRLTIPDTLDVPLTVVDGTPFGAADSETIVPPCGEVPRTTSLTMALFGDVVEIGPEGEVDVTALGATIVIDAPATDECGIGRVWYRASLTPQG